MLGDQDTVRDLFGSGEVTPLTNLHRCNPSGPYVLAGDVAVAVEIDAPTHNAPAPREEELRQFATPDWDTLTVAFSDESEISDGEIEDVIYDVVGAKPATVAEFASATLRLGDEEAYFDSLANSVSVEIAERTSSYVRIAMTIENLSSEFLNDVRAYFMGAEPQSFRNRHGSRSIVSSVNEIGPFAAYSFGPIGRSESVTRIVEVDPNSIGTLSISFSGIATLANDEDGWDDACYKESEVPDPIPDPLPDGGVYPMKETCIDSGCGNIGCQNRVFEWGPSAAEDCNCYLKKQ